MYDGKYGICMNSIYKNRGIKTTFSMQSVNVINFINISLNYINIKYYFI